MTPQAGGAEPEWGTAAANLDLPVEAAGAPDRLSTADRFYALRRARRMGVGVDEVLLATGHASADALARGAARELGVPFEPLDALAPSRLNPDSIAALLKSGLMRCADGRVVLATRGLRLRQLAGTLARRPELRGQLRLSTPERLAAFAQRHFAAQLGWRAANELKRRHPELSAGTLRESRYIFAVLVMAMVALFTPLGQMSALGIWLSVPLLSLLLFGGALLKFAACSLPPQPASPPMRRGAALPPYTLIVPLYREARVVPQLVDALDALDYPREKLQILLVVEPDDAETAAALATRADRPGFEAIVAPALGPRTKPKAMNAALPFARGTYVGVYDAEDIPDPLQWREVCTVFAASGSERLGCVQARLAIDNLADGWITRQFAAEYAGYFDVVLPMLATCRLPLPLGGTSNHFRRDALEGVGAWDPYNVTEDADLGVRLAASGWQTAVIASTTDEEAPRRFGAWMRQRTRWYKGWMQTLLVHTRRPRRLARGAGLTGALALFFLLGSGVAAALINPFLILSVLLDLWTIPTSDPSLGELVLDGINLCVLVLGYTSAMTAIALGMRRRRVPGLWRVLPLVPVYWLMMSAAAWRALFHLVIAPYRWEKTDHGLARTSHRRPRIIRLPLRGNGAARRRRRRAAASG